MARTNREKDFRTKLNEREIQPSPMAWDRLDAMLAVSEGKKAPKKYNWLYVAAGFLGFLFIGAMLFEQTQDMTDAGNPVVTEENSVRDSAIVPAPKAIQPAFENQIENTAVASQEQTQTEPVIVTVTDQANKSRVQVTVKNGNAIANKQVNHDQRETILEQRREAVAGDYSLSQSISTRPDANGQNNQKTEHVKTATYVNVDELLASVEKTPKPKKPGIKVDAGSLLSQVDGELELSFREKVIQAANKQYRNVKVALSNRNVQE